ncbi:NitT/TauT family transport system ATP-binding protein [Ilumatobacter fluminis]|uniref:NitT/TauT family transport system ATP-binding protein n=2 Tax=Ilumatobacter fluminis TaxID=467091 RepID=A0A4V3EJ81_9ACTN|nr:NitT/TauT family transport system ATP-binding protein [Ilumatobacter fluminis]
MVGPSSYRIDPETKRPGNRVVLGFAAMSSSCRIAPDDAASGTSVASFISVDGVHKIFRRKGRAVPALRGVDLDIQAGEFVSLLGPSGCGKSTLLRIIGGLVEPDAGTVTVDGLSPLDARAAKSFGLVPQASSLVPWATVDRNVRFLSQLEPRRSGGHDPLDDDQIDDLLDTVGLRDFRGAYPHELSGGMQQRVSLVRGFALGAPVLLMDEPFAALDEITRADMRYLLLELWQRTGTTVIFVTHSITEAVILSDRVAVMAAHPGRIAALDTIGLDRPRTPEMEDTDVFHDHVRILRTHLLDQHA